MAVIADKKKICSATSNVPKDQPCKRSSSALAFRRRSANSKSLWKQRSLKPPKWKMVIHERVPQAKVYSNARQWQKSSHIRPIPKLRRIATNSHENSHTRRRSIKDEQLEPARGANIGIRWSCDHAIISVTIDSWKDCSLAHRIAVCTTHCANQRDTHFANY
jgi:hypothetical protein